MKRTSLFHPILLATLLTLGACNRESDPRHFDTALHRFDLAASAVSVTFPSTQRVLDEFLSLVVNFEGMEGVLELATKTTGVDLTEETFLAASGLDPDFSPLLFEYDGCAVAVLGIADSQLWSDFLTRTLLRAGLEAQEIRTAEATSLWDVAPSLAFAREGNLWVILHHRPDGALGHLARLLLTPAPAAPQEALSDLIAFKLRIPQWDLLRVARPLLMQMGPAAGLGHALLQQLDNCRAITGTIQPGDRYLATIQTEGCRLPFQGTVTYPPESLLAEDAVAAVTIREPGDSLAAWLSPEQWALINEGWRLLPSKPKAFEDLMGLLAWIEPEISLAFLGFSDTVSVANLFAPKDPLDPLFALHVQALLPLKKGAPVDEWLGPDGLGAFLSDFVSKDLTPDGLSKEYCQEKNDKKCFSIIRFKDRLIAVSGAGEGARLLRAASGQSKSLKSALFAEQKLGPFTFTLKTRRLVRDLVSKGFPPYFVAVLSSILETRIVVQPTEQGSELNIEVVLR